MGVKIFGDSVFQSMRETSATAGALGRGGEGQACPLPDIPGITDRERDILRLLAQGMDNREIARALYLAEGTVRNNISRLLEKLQLKDRTQLAVFAVKNNLD